LASCSNVYNHNLPSVSDVELQRVEQLKEKLNDIRQEVKKHDKDIKEKIEKAEEEKKMGSEKIKAGDEIWNEKTGTKIGAALGGAVAFEVAPLGVLVGGAVGMATDGIITKAYKYTGNKMIEAANSAKEAVLRAKDYLIERYQSYLNGIVKEVEDLSSISKNLEGKDLEELQRLYNKYIVELGEKNKNFGN